MTREQLQAISYRQFTLDDIDCGGSLTPPYRTKADAQLASALVIEWWRGYYAAVDLATNLSAAVAERDWQRSQQLIHDNGQGPSPEELKR